MRSQFSSRLSNSLVKSDYRESGGTSSPVDDKPVPQALASVLAFFRIALLASVHDQALMEDYCVPTRHIDAARPEDGSR